MSKQSSAIFITLVFAALCLVPLRPNSSAIAGDREPAVLLVNMTPDAVSNEASKTCVKRMETIIRNDYAIITRVGETRFRKMVGHPDKSKGFLDWPAKDLAKPKEQRDEYFDTVVLIDCRPDARSVDILVSPPAGGVARIKARKLPITAKFTKTLGQSVLRNSWRGFSP